MLNLLEVAGLDPDRLRERRLRQPSRLPEPANVGRDGAQHGGKSATRHAKPRNLGPVA